MPQKQSLYDELLKGIGDAIVDVREKFVEEPWFGRVVNERGQTMPQWPDAKEVEPQQGQHEHEREAPDNEIDR